MTRDPFDPEVPLALRSAAAGGMGIAGLVFGLVSVRSLELPWLAAVLAGIVAGVALGLLAWRSPQSFFKNRP